MASTLERDYRVRGISIENPLPGTINLTGFAPVQDQLVGAGGAVSLSWTAPTTDSDGNALQESITGYWVTYGLDSLPAGNYPNATQPSPVTNTSITITGLTSAATYRFRVTAITATGVGVPTAELTKVAS